MVTRIGALLLVLVLLAACQSTDSGQMRVPTQPVPTDTMAGDESDAATDADADTDTDTDTDVADGDMIFRVGDNVFTVADYQERIETDLKPSIERFLQQGATREEIIEMAEAQDVMQMVLDRMIQEELLFTMAREEGIGIDPVEVEAELERQKELLSSMGGEEAEMTFEEEEELRADIARQQLLLTMIAQHTTNESFLSRHILVSDIITAELVMDKLDEGEDFADLAEEYSEDPGSKEAGGDLGWVSRGVFVPEFETTALSPSVELNVPVMVESQFGYHIIEVLDRKTEPFTSAESLRNSDNPGAAIDATFVPWYEEARAEAEESGLLEVNEDFDPSTVPLPFPEDMPEEAPTTATEEDSGTDVEEETTPTDDADADAEEDADATPTDDADADAEEDADATPTDDADADAEEDADATPTDDADADAEEDADATPTAEN